MSNPLQVTRVDHLSAHEVDEVLALIAAVADADGARPISEHVMLHLRHGGDERDSHFLVRNQSGHVIGYLHLDGTDLVSGASAELAVAPTARRQGVGTTLVQAALSHYSGKYFRLWAHGEDHGAHALATSMGFTQSRTLLQMRRSLYADLPTPTLPGGVTVRSFTPGVDDDKVLALNNRAFAHHPEQGQWTAADLQVRMNESWFDANGFLLAVANDDIVGFHWTKVHGALHHTHGDKPSHTHAPIGEVYVLGIDPTMRGSGLGRALTIMGLRYLRALGLDEAMLYVESDNAAAIALYESLGFTYWDRDVLYRLAKT